MSWYIDYLIRHNEDIKLSVNKFEDDEVFSDLVSLEIEISRLNKLGLFSEVENKIIRMISEGYSYRGIGRELDMMHRTVITNFKRLCNKLAITLGSKFTDDGFFEYMCNKYNLSFEEEDELIKTVFMKKEVNNEK